MSTIEAKSVASGGSWLTLSLILSVLALLMTMAVKRAKFLYSLRNVPSPTALPFIGNACQLNCSLEGTQISTQLFFFSFLSYLQKVKVPYNFFSFYCRILYTYALDK